MDLLVVLGLTGVGKSTAVAVLGDRYTLLPNRRALTDRFIIPAVQRLDGRPLAPVTDRLERFALTRRYRKRQPGGMVHALKDYLEMQTLGKGPFVFDNLRGLDETRAAVEAFPDARFVLLDAPPSVRLSRLVGRRDPFDELGAEDPNSASFTEQFVAVEGLTEVLDVRVLTRWAAEGAPGSDLLKAARIIVSESQHYGMAAAAAHLRENRGPRDFLSLDTADLSPEVVQERIKGWLG